MEQLHELYKTFIEKLRSLIDSAVPGAEVRIVTGSRYLFVRCLQTSTNIESDVILWLAQYGHLDNGTRVTVTFKCIEDLHSFIKMCVWKNPQYSTLRRDFFPKDYFNILKEKQRIKRAENVQLKLPLRLAKQVKENAGHTWVNEH